jgi:hypothetical protein
MFVGKTKLVAQFINIGTTPQGCTMIISKWEVRRAEDQRGVVRDKCSTFMVL